MDAARRECGYVVVSIFVNPTQFGPNEDLARYPRTFDADRELCEKHGVDAILYPSAADVYPDGFCTHVEPHGLQDLLEGKTRPGHFRGVCTIVLKLFNMVLPDIAFFGQKDAQQAVIICRMVEDLNVPVSIRVMPTVREADGLALSSRNRYLDADQRRHAPALFRVLDETRQRIIAGDRDTGALERRMVADLASVPGARVDYARIVSARTLQPVSPVQGDVLLVLAVYFGTTRLIDNIPLTIHETS
jgi:pantoate--beta-alanine ligase